MKNQKNQNYNGTTLNPERGIGTENMKNYLKRGNGYVWNYFGTEYFFVCDRSDGNMWNCSKADNGWIFERAGQRSRKYEKYKKESTGGDTKKVRGVIVS